MVRARKGNNKYSLKFFGTHEHQDVSLANLAPFADYEHELNGLDDAKGQFKEALSEVGPYVLHHRSVAKARREADPTLFAPCEADGQTTCSFQV